MKLLDKILLATDFTPSCDQVIDHAIEVAKIFHSQIIPIHVLPEDVKNEKARALLIDAAKRSLDEISLKIKNQGIIASEPILEFGSPDDKIVKTSIKEKVNMLMVGAGEKSSNGIFQLGMTAKRIVQKSSKPVWVVTKDGTPNVKTILCPVDFSRTSKRALKNAVTLARRFKADLIILSVFEFFDPSLLQFNFDLEKGNERARLEHMEELNKFLKDVNLTDLNFVNEISGGDPAEIILRTIEGRKPDLLVMGTTGKTGLSRMIIGSVTEKVIREAPCSFITLKTEDFINLQLENELLDIETHFSNGNQLMEDGFYEEAINEYMNCLEINNMHLPAINGIVKIYEKLNDDINAQKFKNMGKEILTKIWDRKIEAEIRKFYNF